MNDATCNIKHGFGDQRCVRRAGHSGRCRSRTYRSSVDGTLTHSEWYSEDGKFKRHHGYFTTYPKNGREVDG
jgi:hypothetical protein